MLTPSTGEGRYLLQLFHIDDVDSRSSILLKDAIDRIRDVPDSINLIRRGVEIDCYTCWLAFVCELCNY